MKWSELKPGVQYAIIGGACLLVGAGVTAAVLLSRTEKPATIVGTLPEATATVDATGTAVPTETVDVVVVTPPPTKQPTPSTPAPKPDNRVFGQLKGIRDESGGAWTDLWIDIDTADFLTGQKALDYLTSIGDQDFYNAKYWYVRQEGAAVTSYHLPSSSAQTKVKVVMYTWPNTPAPGFYGSSMTPQNVGFGEFYDEIYMYGDTKSLRNRYYWFTVTNDVCTKLEEQPRDPYYEP
ncbi:MAG: hypothetical protein CVT59_08795 [Actinobacteria bacterium HGW-Actinobacteria-1]|jgi:hypothetical protein|nr:MAG: hypothetical protein CVT59_08795 [Actinobacteria bacterium HGW-Actinobacteria-1]